MILSTTASDLSSSAIKSVILGRLQTDVTFFKASLLFMLPFSAIVT